MCTALFSFLLLIALSSAQSNSCGGTTILNATTELQNFTTPNYETSYKYPPFLDCKFIIKAPDKSRIQINIIEMEMEPRVFPECSDYVGIVPELDDKNISNVIKLCQNLRNYQYISPSNTVTILFQSDDVVEYRGAKLSYRYFDTFSCPPGWHELSDQNCVKLEEIELDWIRAQNRCLTQQSNLLLIDSSDKTLELEDFYKSVPRKLWIGYTDAASEGRLDALDARAPKNIPGRDPATSYTDNNDINDCMTLQFGDNHPYRMDSCASYNQFICEMKKDGTTALYPPPVDDIEDGGMGGNGSYILYVLLFLIGLLILTIMTFMCFMCWKRKDTRVHTEHEPNQQNAFISETAHRSESGGGQAVAVSRPPSNTNAANKSARNSPISTPLENNRHPPKRFPMAPVPNRLPFAEESSEGEKVTETAIMSGGDEEEVSGAPKALPRTLPPMPAREGTFQSIKTTDGSTMRTRRNRELFERPIMNVLDNVSAISLDEFWSNKQP